MKKSYRSLTFGGAAVLGLFLTGSALVTSPQPMVQAQMIVPKPAYLAYIRDDDSLYRKLGIPKQLLNEPESQTKPEAKKLAVAETKPQPKTKVALRPPVKPPQKVQVASRSTGPAVSPDLIRYALSFQGVPYKWGGTTPQGFDCSGYTQYVFAKFGIKLPRDSFGQFRVGTAVAKSQLEPGDLVFFNTNGPGASHVGISLGGSKFIDSSNSGVGVQSFSSGYWAKHYIGARRVK